jgi:hypothetical protein
LLTTVNNTTADAASARLPTASMSTTGALRFRITTVASGSAGPRHRKLLIILGAVQQQRNRCRSQGKQKVFFF